jgi:hypothetical protein
LGTFLLEYAAREVELETVQVRDVQYSAMVPALIVRFVQLRWTRWLQPQWNSPVHIPVPDLNDLFTQIEIDVAWELTFPMQYLRLAAPPTAPVLPGAPPAARQPSAAPLRRLVATSKTPLFQTQIILKPASHSGSGST